ncbi:hypothetical protein YC2023_041679 [Brassica napus]
MLTLFGLNSVTRVSPNLNTVNRSMKQTITRAPSTFEATDNVSTTKHTITRLSSAYTVAFQKLLTNTTIGFSFRYSPKL